MDRWAREFRHEYNYERPHESLGNKTPGEVYQAVNLRTYQAQPREWEYSGGVVKSLNTKGMLYYRQETYFVSEALAAERVRVDELDGKLLVTFRHMTVREIELTTGKSSAVILSVRSESEKARAVETVEKQTAFFHTFPQPLLLLNKKCKGCVDNKT